MHQFAALAAIMAALTLGVISPGPSFVMVARTTLAASRGAGVAAALGMGLGGMVFATSALLGLRGLFLAAPSLYWGFRLAGGIYLAYLGWRIWQGAARPLTLTAGPDGRSGRFGRFLLLGFSTQISNPKTAVVYASVFAAFLPAEPGLAFALALLGLIFLMESLWYSLVAVALSAERPRAAYLRFKKRLDRTAGTVMGLLGLKLMLSAAP